jgi:F-type H+-transporting ATPase subunit gamma
LASNIRDLRRRIRSVKNTSQLTRAMKMVSAAKLRRAQESMLGARPYSSALERVLVEVAERTSGEIHPLLVARETKIVELVVLAGDKGLCGSFNAAVLRAADRAIREQRDAGRDVRLTIIGKKAVEYYRRREARIVEAHGDLFREFDYSAAADIARNLQERYVAGESDAVHLVYNEFKSAISQRLIVQPLLPIGGLEEKKKDEKVDYLYEPEASALLADLLPRYLAFCLYHAMLESVAAEHAARMTAMDSATRNAEEMIEKLTLVMNRARQAAITTEIIEVVSGAEALG